MRELVTCAQMKALDQDTIEDKGVPSLVLMERAALSVVEELQKQQACLDAVLVVCGTGNNGGDGIAIARLLALKGYTVDYCLTGEQDKCSTQTRRQLIIAENYHVSRVEQPKWDTYTTIVDAIFGIGLSRDVSGRYAEVIEKINHTDAYVASVDIPSGVNGDSGRVLAHAVSADLTVTFAYGKPGLYLYPGAVFSGKVVVQDIGIYHGKEQENAYLQVLDDSDLCKLPPRPENGNKGTFGKALVIAGSHNMAGAAYLSAAAALCAGCGMVKIHTPEDNRIILQERLPEALLYTDAADAKDPAVAWMQNLKWADAVVLGPGIGQSPEACRMCAFYLEHCDKPIVLDADALNLLSVHPDWWQFGGAHWILTPHPGELGRLVDMSPKEVKETLLEVPRKLAQEHGVTCIAKDARSVTVTAHGQSYLNLSGCDGMASAGSGDVLSGLIGGLLARGSAPSLAAPLGVYLHGRSGTKAAHRYGRSAMKASHIIEETGMILKEIEG